MTDIVKLDLKQVRPNTAEKVFEEILFGVYRYKLSAVSFSLPNCLKILY